MAKFVIELEDSPTGELTLRFTADDARTAKTAATNTAAQNAGIMIAQHLRSVGIKAPDLSGESFSDELVQGGFRLQ